MKVNMILVVYKTSNASKQPKRLKKNLKKKIMSFPPSGILGTHNGLGLISSMDTALRPVIAKVLVKHDCFFQVLFQPLRLFHSTAMIIVFTFKSSRSSAIQNLIYFISQ